MPSRGEGLFPAFVSYLKSFDSPREDENKAALEAKLKEIDWFLEVPRAVGDEGTLRASSRGDGPKNAWPETQVTTHTSNIPQDNGDNPFIHGRTPGVNDFELAPKLHHVDVVTRHFRVRAREVAYVWRTPCQPRLI